MTYVSCDNRLKCFRGVISNPPPISSNVPSDCTYHICCRFFFNKQPALLCLFTSRCTVHSMPRSRFRNLTTLSIRYLACILFHIKKSPVLHNTSYITRQTVYFTLRASALHCSYIPKPKKHLLHIHHTKYWKPDEMTQYKRNACDKPRGP